MGRKPGSKNKFSKSQDAEEALMPGDASAESQEDEKEEIEQTEGPTELKGDGSGESLPDFSQAAKGFDKAVSSEEVSEEVKSETNLDIPGKYRKFLKGGK